MTRGSLFRSGRTSINFPHSSSSVWSTASFSHGFANDSPFACSPPASEARQPTCGPLPFSFRYPLWQLLTWRVYFSKWFKFRFKSRRPLSLNSEWFVSIGHRGLAGKKFCLKIFCCIEHTGQPPLWSSGQSS
jgi:hypothetical protein